MKELHIDAAKWKSKDDLWLAFFEAVKAPSWHGRNFNALRDSVGTGDINGMEVPYRLVILNYGALSPELKAFTDDFIGVLHELAAKRNVPVEVRVAPKA